MIIAIDGPAASGKGTLAKRLAAHLGLRHLDTGLLYRAVGAALVDAGIALDDEAAAMRAARDLDPASFDPARLRTAAAGEAASRVAAQPGVRAALIELQRAFAAIPPGAVLDGRDIGTVVCPEAHVKLFVTASPEERARRRAVELRAAGEAVDEAVLAAEIRTRDERDAARPIAPLRPAADAILLDTTELDIEAAFRAALALVDRVRGSARA